MSRLLCACSIALFSLHSATAADNYASKEGSSSQEQSLDPQTPEDPDALPTVFREMGVVQKKSMQKAGKVLFAPFFSMDFSDSPYGLYGINTNIGYGVSDFFEIYANLTPFFLNPKRSIVDKVESLQLANGQRATIVSAKAKRQYGLELLWAPGYGKDSFGISSLIRSDTFFKLGVAQISYDSGNGLKFHLGVGKTYFLSKRMGLRATISANYLQTITDGKKEFITAAMIEGGVVLYLF